MKLALIEAAAARNKLTQFTNSTFQKGRLRRGLWSIAEFLLCKGKLRDNSSRNIYNLLFSKLARRNLQVFSLAP